MCQSFGAKLAEIETVEENSYVQDYLRATLSKYSINSGDYSAAKLAMFDCINIPEHQELAMIYECEILILAMWDWNKEYRTIRSYVL